MAVCMHECVRRTALSCLDCIAQVFGVEAARAVLLQEFKKVMSFDSSYVNHRHLLLLADCMTCKSLLHLVRFGLLTVFVKQIVGPLLVLNLCEGNGQLMPITRHGLNKLGSGPLIRCTFEESCEILLEAGSYALLMLYRALLLDYRVKASE